MGCFTSRVPFQTRPRKPRIWKKPPKLAKLYDHWEVFWGHRAYLQGPCYQGDSKSLLFAWTSRVSLQLLWICRVIKRMFRRGLLPNHPSSSVCIRVCFLTLLMPQICCISWMLQKRPLLGELLLSAPWLYKVNQP